MKVPLSWIWGIAGGTAATIINQHTNAGWGSLVIILSGVILGVIDHKWRTND